MSNDIFLTAYQEAKDQEQEAAVAIVVRRDAPSSGKPGDKAIITKDGMIKGWIGGGCTRGIAIKESLEAIRDQSPRLVRIQPGLNAPEQSGVKNYKMTCMSGGTVEIFIEPIITTYQLTIIGRSHIAKALCEIASAAGFVVNVVSDLADDGMFPQAKTILPLQSFEIKPMPIQYVVVCTQGEQDAQGLLKAVQSNPRYIAFVASRKKANGIFMDLRREGVTTEQLMKIKTPAGLDIGAKTPQEVAISILAEIFQERRKVTESNYTMNQDGSASKSEALDEDLYINPVCKIPVQKSSAKHILDYQGELVYFCCDGCKVKFESSPQDYMGTEKD